MSINTAVAQLPLNQWLPEICHIAYQAGQLIGRYYRQNSVNIEKKSDGTPVTEADLAADKVISKALRALTPDIPIITEETLAQIDFEKRQHWATFWLVDPLDGTKEFIDQTGEYSVNIALVVDHKPVLGVVYGPELGNLYFASHQLNDAMQMPCGKLKGLWPQQQAQDTADSASLNWDYLLKQAAAIGVAEHPQQLKRQRSFKVAVSRRHGSQVQSFMNDLGMAQAMKMGSALKACLVAEGAVDVYPRFGPTSLWDTAASQAIVEAAGGAILNAAGHPLQYVQTPSLLNPFFIVVSHADYQWPKFPEVM
ncbi:3'(2'),5'-bisphosphate nucleotidase CysQ family protein [Thiomicrorhabdus sediminis]|uniref:3'(2'),5'-bisphosphate nucleotidase CysQ n=1 Tax=Thiomicrorhabdus sediminis TaxID=2580412 RepID=A0A4P9K8Q4_9GAMM|nr:inositol monophosphatase family protein [Thiomicrorhabdus sediminis]QCU90796.1 3'(2'),5'-bisphosphate nucleotidase CysQ [Thiomicrorhabdus sediminis]